MVHPQAIVIHREKGEAPERRGDSLVRSAAFSLRQPGLQQEKLSINCLERQVGEAPGRLEHGGLWLGNGSSGEHFKWEGNNQIVI